MAKVDGPNLVWPKLVTPSCTSFNFFFVTRGYSITTTCCHLKLQTQKSHNQPQCAIKDSFGLYSRYDLTFSSIIIHFFPIVVWPLFFPLLFDLVVPPLFVSFVPIIIWLCSTLLFVTTLNRKTPESVFSVWGFQGFRVSQLLCGALKKICAGGSENTCFHRNEKSRNLPLSVRWWCVRIWRIDVETYHWLETTRWSEVWVLSEEDECFSGLWKSWCPMFWGRKALNRLGVPLSLPYLPNDTQEVPLVWGTLNYGSARHFLRAMSKKLCEGVTRLRATPSHEHGLCLPLGFQLKGPLKPQRWVGV